MTSARTSTHASSISKKQSQQQTARSKPVIMTKRKAQRSQINWPMVFTGLSCAQRKAFIELYLP